MTLASGGSPIFPLVVHRPDSPSMWPAVQLLLWGLSTNPGVTCGAYMGAVVVVLLSVHVHFNLGLSPRDS